MRGCAIFTEKLQNKDCGFLIPLYFVSCFGVDQDTSCFIIFHGLRHVALIIYVPNERLSEEVSDVRSAWIFKQLKQ